MGVYMQLIEITKERFDAFQKAFENKNFWQTSQMGAFKQNQGYKIYYVGLEKDNEILAATCLCAWPMFLGYSYFTALRGFLIDYSNRALVDEFLKGLKVFLHNHKCLYMETDPYVKYQDHDKEGNAIEGTKNTSLLQVFEQNAFVHQGFQNDLNLSHEPRWMQILDLEGQNTASLMKNMNSNTKRNIKNLSKQGVHVCFLDESRYKEIADFVNNTGSKKGFSGPTLSYYLAFHKAFKDDMKVAMAYLDIDEYLAFVQTKKDEKKIEVAYNCQHLYGKTMPLGAAMFVENPHEIVYVFGGSNKTPIRLSEGHAIQWYMIQYALDKKIKIYNFYGISGDFSEDANDYGVYRFKKGFNADVIELIGRFRYVDQKMVYFIYKALKSVKNLIK